MKSRDLQPILFHPAKISFKIEGQIKSFPDKRKIKEFIVTKLLLYEMLKGLIQQKRKIKPMNNKMVINTNLSTIESKKKMGWGCGGIGEEVRGLRSTKR